MTTKITILNDFHNSEYTLRVPALPARLSAGQVRRCRRALCCIPGCTCGGNLGERGSQEVEVYVADGEAFGLREVSP